MSMDWFRTHHGAPTDPKWLLVAKRANVRPIHVIGVWWALLDYASQHPDRGTIDGFDAETFALFAGLDEEHVSRIVTTLRDKSLIVGNRIAQWEKRQPKREDGGAAERQRRHRANKPKTGGNPPNGGGGDTPDSTGNAERHAMSRDVTPDKRRVDKKEGSVANATGTVVPHPAADFCKAIFDSGVALLVNAGCKAAPARSFLGRLRADLKDDPAMLTILKAAEIEQPSDPKAWLTAAVETRNGTRTRRSNSGESATGLGRTGDALADFVRETTDPHAGRVRDGDWPAPDAHRALGYGG